MESRRNGPQLSSRHDDDDDDDVSAQWQFKVLLAALLICLLHTWTQFYVLFLFETVTILVSCVTLPS